MKPLYYTIAISIGSLLINSENYGYIILFCLSMIFSFLFLEKSKTAFAIGFATVTTAWTIYLWYLSLSSTSNVVKMIGQIFQGLNEFNLIILSAFIGGITAGLGAYLGSKIKNLIYA
jgi:hypothetical protein